MIEELGESKLGTKAYWDEIYSNELNQYAECGDEGEVWFGKRTANLMVQYVAKHIPDKTIRIIDLGCGNGHLCQSLAAKGYNNVLGVDYSADAINLCLNIAKDDETGFSPPDYKTVDILDMKSLSGELFQVVLDKGTFDAVSLMPYKDDGQITPADEYVLNLDRIMGPEAIFVLTSCNWTQTELVSRFQDSKNWKDRHFCLVDVIPHASFSFGNATGQQVTTLVFKTTK